MAVTISSARIDERGKTSGGKAGDQTGKEVSAQNWYKHSKGWRTLVCTIPGAGNLIAECMELAYKDPQIGYDQNQRNTLWNALKDVGCDVRKLQKAVETDCSALVRLCVAYALFKLGKIKTPAEIEDFITSTLANKLLATGFFKELTGSKYNDQSAYLQRGMIQVTRTKGHVIVVLTNGSKAGATPEAETVYKLGDRILKNGMEGPDVKEMQGMLLELNPKKYNLGSWGADGDFGDQTEIAVRRFQGDHGCVVDGQVGPKTLVALTAALEASGEEPITGKKVKIYDGDCYIRSTPNTSNKPLGVAKEGSEFEYRDQTSADGWFMIRYDDNDAWVSGKYGRLMK